MILFYILLAILSGLCMGIQSPINATLSRYVGHLQATTLSFGGGAICLGILVLTIGTGDLSRITDAAWWQLLGGTYGAYIVFIITYAIPRLGAALTSTILTFGQLITAAVLDTFGLMGLPQVPLAPARVAGCFVVLVGVILVYLGKRKQEQGKTLAKDHLAVMLFLAFGGMAGAIQAPTNNSLAGLVGTVEASFVSFSVGFLVILTLTLIATKGHLLKEKKDGIQGWMLSGGFFGAAVVFINLIAIATLGSTVLQICTMLGQLGGGMVIDNFGMFRTAKIKANSWRWAGVLVIACGATIVALSKL